MKTAAAVVLFAACLSAQKQTTAEELVIKRLSNPDAAAADAAMIDLIRGGLPSATVLRKALATCKDPAFRARAERALAICAVDAPVDNGVKVGLRADRKELQPGETVTLTATICNVSTAPVSIYLGMLSSGQVLQNGLALQRLTAKDDGPVQARFGNVGFCGTGARALIEVLPPWTSKEFTASAEYRVKPKAGSCIPHEGPHLAVMYVFLPVEPAAEGGKVKLRLHHEVDPAKITMVPPGTKADWKGTLASNTIEVSLREPAGR